MTEHDDETFGPAQFLVENVDLLPKGRALDVAMGSGRNAIFLAGIGFDVEGVDISQESTDRALQAARKAGVDLKVTVRDLEEDYQFETGAYDLIVCFNYLHRPLIPKMKEGLRSHGMVVYETYIVDQAQFGRPRNPDHLLKHNELLDLFREFRCLRYHEGLMTPRRALAGIIAKKP